MEYNLDTCVLCARYKPQHAPTSFQAQPDMLTLNANCDRCGIYKIDTFLTNDRRGLDEDLGLRLSGLTRAATGRDEQLHIRESNYRALAATAPVPRTYAARVDWLLLELARLCRYPGRLTEQMALDQLAALAFLPRNSLAALFTQMAEEKLVKVIDDDHLRYRVSLLAQGWTRVDQLQASSPRGDKAFVAMWFSDQMKPAYEQGIKPALAACGYDPPFRVDDPEHESRVHEPDYQPKIDDRIMAEIRRARFLVVDVTGSRMAVYFEAGFA